MEIQFHALLPSALDGTSFRIRAATALSPRETSPFTHYTSVGGRTGLNSMSVRTGERKNLCPCGVSSPGLLSRRCLLSWLCSSVRHSFWSEFGRTSCRLLLSATHRTCRYSLTPSIFFFFGWAIWRSLPREIENFGAEDAKAPYSICKIKIWFKRIIGLYMTSHLRNLCAHLFINSFSLYMKNEDLIICAVSCVIASILPWLNRRSRYLADIGNMRCEQIFFPETPWKMCGPG
jgi:hypothetical protein